MSKLERIARNTRRVLTQQDNQTALWQRKWTAKTAGVNAKQDKWL